jgi:hypothetical protein
LHHGALQRDFCGSLPSHEGQHRGLPNHPKSSLFEAMSGEHGLGSATLRHKVPQPQADMSSSAEVGGVEGGARRRC